MNQPDLDLTKRSEQILKVLTKTLEACSTQQS